MKVDKVKPGDRIWGWLKWAFEQSGLGGWIATGLWATILASISPHLETVKKYAFEHPFHSAGVAVLLGFSLYGMATTFRQIREKFRGKATAGANVASVVLVNPAPSEPFEPSKYTSDSVPLNIQRHSQDPTVGELKVHWRWEDGLPVGFEFECPFCPARLELTSADRTNRILAECANCQWRGSIYTDVAKFNGIVTRTILGRRKAKEATR